VPPPPPTCTHLMVTRAQTGNLKTKQVQSFNVLSVATIEPKSYTQATKIPYWRDAMTDEYNTLLSNGTWCLVPPSSSQNMVGCRWVFKQKKNANGAVERYKACLVAKGYHQRPGVDFADTFSPVVRPTTIRLLLSIAVGQRWPICQIGISNAFLHGKLDADVFMSQPPGFVDPTCPDYVCELDKSIYDLK
jgi:hypothetical protein